MQLQTNVHEPCKQDPVRSHTASGPHSAASASSQALMCLQNPPPSQPSGPHVNAPSNTKLPKHSGTQLSPVAPVQLVAESSTVNVSHAVGSHQ